MYLISAILAAEREQAPYGSWLLVHRDGASLFRHQDTYMARDHAGTLLATTDRLERALVALEEVETLVVTISDGWRLASLREKGASVGGDAPGGENRAGARKTP